jgi:hypothetical protein
MLVIEMTEHEEQRAWDVFRRELEALRNPRAALRAALIDYVGREAHGRRISANEVGKPTPSLLPLVRQVCSFVNAEVGDVCSTGHATKPVSKARVLIVSILSDGGMSAKKIADATGIGMSVVANCRGIRNRSPELEPIIAHLTETNSASSGKAA